MSESRAQDLLELVERSRRGRLKVYLGFAAGVGKTYRMLQEAHELRRRGVDVVLAFIETHGRAETRDLIGDLPVVPRRAHSYRGITIEEMDLEAVLARDPQLAIVDELAHSNVPGCRNNKRYQDVLALVGAGINVITAFNIQHLESLNDLVERATGVVVRETVPDSFLQQADQVVTLDLTVEDLLERLRAGKIYAEDKTPQALRHFFRPENLSTLRELSLREVAESLDRRGPPLGAARDGGPSSTGAPGRGRRGPAGGRVLVCIASDPPRAAALLRRGSRMAGRLNTDWFVLYVETPREAPHLIDAETQRHLQDNTNLARELGAEVVRIKARDPAAAILDFARSHSVGVIVLGRSPRSFFAQVLTGGVVPRLLQEARDFDLHIVSLELGEGEGS